MDLRILASIIKARWICEQAHQQLKEELGLDHFEGRSWHGLHRHALMTMIAYAFLQHRRFTKVRREKKNQRRHLNRRCRPSGTPSSISSCDQSLGDVRTAEAGSTRSSGVNKSAKVVLVRAPHTSPRRSLAEPCRSEYQQIRNSSKATCNTRSVDCLI